MTAMRPQRGFQTRDDRPILLKHDYVIMCTCIQRRNLDDPTTWALLLLLICQIESSSDAIDERSGVLMYDAWRNRVESSIVRNASSSHEWYAVMIVDLDHFKSINDRFGHLAGDHVIAAVADVIRTEAHADDLIGRFGGDEFAVLVHVGDQKRRSLEHVAERIRIGVENLALTVTSPTGPMSINGVTVSIGAATSIGVAATSADDSLSEDGLPELTALLWAADEQLYKAKHAGRNTIRVRQPPRNRPGRHR